MGFMDWVGIIIAIWIIFKIYKAFTKPKIDIQIKSSLSSSNNYDDWEYENNIIDDGERGKIINPDAPLPMTIYGLPDDKLDKLVDYLNIMAHDRDRLAGITYLLAQYNAGCREVDEYIKKQRAYYRRQINRLIKESDEWDSASELDRNEMLMEFREDILKNMPNRANDEDALIIAIENEPSNITEDDELLKLFEGKSLLYQFYVANLGYVGKVIKVSADDYYRRQYEELHKMGLANRGKEIPAKDLLQKLRLKDINEILSDILDKKFRRKADAVKFAAIMDDIYERMSKVTSFRNLYQILAPENINIDEIKKCFEYANAMARLIADTYVHNYYTMRTLSTEDRTGKWEIWTHDCCITCQNMKKTYKKLPKKLPPFHIGCNCELTRAW